MKPKLKLLLGCMLMCMGACLLSGTALAGADEPDYVPLFAPESVHSLKLADCMLQAESGFVMNINETTTAHCGDHDITIIGVAKSRRDTGETTHVAVNLTGRQQTTFEAVLRLNDFPASFVDSVEFADLNGDGKDDYVLNLSAHGNGLAAKIGGTLFLLSSAKGYRYLGLAEVMNNVPRYVRFGDNPQAVLILQRWVLDKNGSHSVRGLDKKSHTFFVFDLLQFDTDAPKGVRLNNSLDARFPFWALYTNEPSHAETTLLTQSRKKVRWHDPLARAVSGRLLEH